MIEILNLKTQSKGVGIINSAPLSMGLYTETGAPSWNRAPCEVKKAVKEAFEYCQVFRLINKIN